MTFPCRVGAWTGFHEWRMIDELPHGWQRMGIADDGKPLLFEVPARRRWYCTRCRLVEETPV